MQIFFALLRRMIEIKRNEKLFGITKDPRKSSERSAKEALKWQYKFSKKAKLKYLKYVS